MGRHLGIDLGGTNIKLVVLQRDGAATPAIVATASVPTLADQGPEAVAARIVAAGEAMRGEHGPIDTFGVGVPGLFDRDSGRIELFPNLPGPWAGFPLRDRLTAGFGSVPGIVNDARAFVLAEATLGAGRGRRTVVGVTLGTGVGGGLVIEGRLHLGASGTAGEIGHQTVDPAGPVCGCGNRGCVEPLAQAATIARLGRRPTAEAVFAGAAAGDPTCRAAVEAAVGALAIGIANVVTVLVPDVVVVGGGMAGANAVLLDPLRAAVAARTPLLPEGTVPIVPAELGPKAGAMGAALAAAGGISPAAAAGQ